MEKLMALPELGTVDQLLAVRLNGLLCNSQPGWLVGQLRVRSGPEML